MPLHSLLVGRDRHATIRWVAVSVALCLCSLGFFALVNRRFPPLDAVHAVLWWEGYALALAGVVVLQAYDSGSLLASWALVAAGVAGVVSNYGGIALTGGPPAFLELVVLAVVGGAGGALALGTPAFAVGVGLRRLLSVDPS